MGLSKDDSSATVHHSTNREADPSAPAHSVVVPVRARTAAASTTPKTAGFFSTFSLDLPGKTSTSNTAAGDGKHILHLGTTDVVTDSLGAAPAQYAVRRRNRRVFVCLPCHGRKLRCDRRKPACGRCVAAGLGDSCTYEKASGERSRADEGVVKGDGRRRHASGSGSGPAATLADRETVSPSIEGHGVGADERRYPDGGDDIGSDVEDDDDSDDAVDAWEMSCYKKSEGRARVSKTSHWAMISAEVSVALPPTAAVAMSTTD